MAKPWFMVRNRYRSGEEL